MLQRRKDGLSSTKTRKCCKAKLPKLVLTKFNGTRLDWFRLWNRLQAEIDSNVTISNIMKFLHLKELAVLSVHASIEGIQFKIDGYQKAKSILQTKYDKTSEIATPQVQHNMQLLVGFKKNPVKVHKFYEKLVTHAQALKIMQKLQEVNGIVCLLYTVYLMPLVQY